VGFDPQGNLANWNGVLYAFDYGNRLRSIAGVDAYRYDAWGRRIRQSNASGPIYSLYGREGTLLWQRNERTGQRRNYVYLQGSLLAEDRTPLVGSTETITYQHTDALGTPVATTNASKAVLQTSEYEPYGKLLNRPMEDGPDFTGHVSDAGSKLVYMQQRYYDPRTGRFWSTDPVTAYEQPLTNFNRYNYAFNNPYKFTDPDGRDGEFDALKAVVLVAVIDVETPDPTDAAAPVKVAGYAGAVIGTAIGGALVYGYNTVRENYLTDTDVNETSDSGKGSNVQQAKEHTKGKRPSTKGKHEKGQARKDRDRGGEKGDGGRRPPRKPPPDHKGPWPPKPEQGS
jgi:RHS repeat-associated protein